MGGVSMQELKGYFIGYKTFKSRKDNKDYYVLSILLLTDDNEHNRVTYFVKDIFVDDKKYYNFVDNASIFDAVTVTCEVSGDKVYYRL